MASVEIDVSQMNTLAADLGRASFYIAAQASKAVRKTGEDIVREAQAFAPVRTGNLRNSIGADYDGDGLGFEAGPTASYGGYVELGTSKMAPHAYMGPAFDRATPGFVQAVEQLGGNILP
jgi:HK97 gp10 family phage protein